MKKTLLLATVFLIISCENKSTEIRYYPTDRDFSEENSLIIELDSTQLNYRGIIKRIGAYEEDHYGKVAVEFKDGDIIKRIIPYIFDSGLYKNKNRFKIKSDSILEDGGYNIDQLKPLLKRHYLNKGKHPYYSVSPAKAIVEVEIDRSKGGNELKKILTKLTRSFDEIKSEINDTIELRVFFNYSRQMPPPPMPSQTELNESSGG